MRRRVLIASLLLAACGGASPGEAPDGGAPEADMAAEIPDAGVPDAAPPADLAVAPEPCVGIRPTPVMRGDILVFEDRSRVDKGRSKIYCFDTMLAARAVRIDAVDQCLYSEYYLEITPAAGSRYADGTLLPSFTRVTQGSYGSRTRPAGYVPRTTIKVQIFGLNDAQSGCAGTNPYALGVEVIP